jgi:hypothetical protein
MPFRRTERIVQVMRLDHSTELPERPCCAACGARIGVYEPIVDANGTTVRRTPAARPASHGLEFTVRLFHTGCYEASD